MTENDILIVAGAAGLALVITLADLVFSAVRWRRSAKVRIHSDGLNRSPQDEAAAAARSAWIGQRLAAIQNASKESQ